MEILQDIALAVTALLVVAWVIKGVGLLLSPKRKPRKED